MLCLGIRPDAVIFKHELEVDSAEGRSAFALAFVGMRPFEAPEPSEKRLSRLHVAESREFRGVDGVPVDTPGRRRSR